MMKRILLIFLVVMSIMNVSAQIEFKRVTIMPRVGVTASTMWGEQATGSRLRIGAVAGADIEYRFSQKWGAQIGVEGLLIGSNIHSEVEHSANALLVGYVGVPVMADFHVAPRWTVKAGVEPAYKVKAAAKNGNKYVDFDKYVKKYDITIPVAASFDITKHWVTEARINVGVCSIMKADGIAVRNLAFSLTMGYKF